MGWGVGGKVNVAEFPEIIGGPTARVLNKAVMLVVLAVLSDRIVISALNLALKAAKIVL